MKTHAPLKYLTVALTMLLAVGNANAQHATPALATAPQATQQVSTLSLTFAAPRQATTVQIVQSLPAGSSYVAGSSRLNGQPLPEPQRGPSGLLYWQIPVTLPSGFSGTLSYQVAHQQPLTEWSAPGLRVLLPHNRAEVLSGTFDLNDFQAAQALNETGVVARPENAGAIKLPLAGSAVQVRDRINVVVEVPTGERPTLRVDDQTVSADWIGSVQAVADGKERLTYVGVPLKVGQNTIQYGKDTLKLERVGKPIRLEVVPMQLVADGVTPLRLKIRSLDAAGQLTASGTVTLESNLEPYIQDADPHQAGYQVLLTDGEGELLLRPQSAPATLRLGLLVGDQMIERQFEVVSSRQQVAVGIISVAVGLNSNYSLADNVKWQARGTIEAPLGDGKLYLVADKDGLPTDRDTLKRYNVYGDSSISSVPLQGIDPVAALYDHPDFRVQYRQTALPMDVLPVGEQLTALSAYTKSNPELAGFIAFVPRERVTDEQVAPEGTHLVRLRFGGVAAGSETLQLVTLNKVTGAELRRVTLVRNVDYQLDTDSGVITLSRALTTFDNELNPQYISASYRLKAPMSERGLAYGAQVKYQEKNFSVGAAAVSLDDHLTFGVRATYTQEQNRADMRVAYSGGVMLDASANAKFDRTDLAANVHYQDERYAGVGKGKVGVNVNAKGQMQITDTTKAILEGKYERAGQGDNLTEQGDVTARAEVEYKPFSVGGGVKYSFGDLHGLSGVVSAGYHQDPLQVEVVHAQPISGTVLPETKFNVKYRVAENVMLGLVDTYKWGKGHAATLSLDSTVGRTNYAVAYELPNADGQGNRARFGVTTVLPLSSELSLGLHGSALYDLHNNANSQVTLGSDLNYQTKKLTASVGSDLVYNNSGFGVVARGGVTGVVNPNLSLSADALAEFGAGKNGQRFSVGYAYRQAQLASLGTVRYVNGTLAGNKPEFSSNLGVEYRQTLWAVRAGLDTRTLLKDTSSFTWQANLGANIYPVDRLSVGGWLNYFSQPDTSVSQVGYGLSAGYRVLPGTWLTAGYNFKGFDGISNLYTRQGLYVRLDLALDEAVAASFGDKQ